MNQKNKDILIIESLAELHQSELTHLENEFENYKLLYPVNASDNND